MNMPSDKKRLKELQLQELCDLILPLQKDPLEWFSVGDIRPKNEIRPRTGGRRYTLLSQSVEGQWPSVVWKVGAWDLVAKADKVPEEFIDISGQKMKEHLETYSPKVIVSELACALFGEDKEQLRKDKRAQRTEEVSGRKTGGFGHGEGILLDRLFNYDVFASLVDLEVPEKQNLATVEAVDGAIELGLEGHELVERIDMKLWLSVWDANTKPLHTVFKHAKELGLSELVIKECCQILKKLDPVLARKAHARAEERLLSELIGSGVEVKSSSRAIKL